MGAQWQWDHEGRGLMHLKLATHWRVISVLGLRMTRRIRDARSDCGQGNVGSWEEDSKQKRALVGSLTPTWYMCTLLGAIAIVTLVDVLGSSTYCSFKTLGKLKSASVDKRFEVLTGFFSFLKEKGLLVDDSFLKSYKRTEIVVTSKIKTTLSISEIHKLYAHKFEDETKEKVKLIFLFSCLTVFSIEGHRGF